MKSFKTEGVIKTFEIKAKGIVTTTLALEELRKEVFQAEGKTYLMEIHIHGQGGEQSSGLKGFTLWALICC